MNPKRHPLEIFKKHGPFNAKEAKRHAPSPVKPGKAKKPSSLLGLKESFFNKKPEKSVLPNRAAATPGDWRISLSLNHILFILVIVMVICLGTYFMGYHKGLRISEDGSGPSLKETMSPAGDIDQIYKAQPFNDKDLVLNKDAKVLVRWGVKVVQYSKGGLAIAREAEGWLNQWLEKHKKNAQAQLRPLQDSDSYIIIIGSFADQENQELKRLLQEIQSINDYPYGSDKSPFDTARVIQYYSAENSGQ